MNDSELYIKKVGDRIVQLREERGLKQIDLAVQLDMEDSALRRIEKGRTNPTIKTLYLISKELGLTVSELLNFE